MTTFFNTSNIPQVYSTDGRIVGAGERCEADTSDVVTALLVDQGTLIEKTDGADRKSTSKPAPKMSGVPTPRGDGEVS